VHRLLTIAAAIVAVFAIVRRLLEFSPADEQQVQQQQQQQERDFAGCRRAGASSDKVRSAAAVASCCLAAAPCIFSPIQLQILFGLSCCWRGAMQSSGGVVQTINLRY
jgi:hypothetical protein